MFRRVWAGLGSPSASPIVRNKEASMSHHARYYASRHKAPFTRARGGRVHLKRLEAYSSHQATKLTQGTYGGNGAGRRLG